MITNIYTFRPGIAALVYVTKNSLTGGSPVSAVFLSTDKGVVVGRRDTPLAEYGWPQEVQDQLTQHFAKVFALEHENRLANTPSPRALYVDSLQPWEIQVQEEDQ